MDKGAVIGVAGAGAMGSGIAQVAAAAGHRVLLFDSKSGAAEAGKHRTAAALAKVVEKGKMRATDREALLSLIQPVESLGELKECGLVIEAIVEDLAAKKSLFQQLQGIAPGAVLTSNTSSLSITEMAAGLSRPDRFAGLHFFNPAPLMELVEVVKGFETSDEVMAELIDLMRAWKKSAVRVKNSPGFIVNRCARPFYNEPLRFLEEGGADVATIDACFRGAGFKMGPFELIDFVGLDVNLAVSKSIFNAFYGEPRFRPSRLVEELVAAGHLGRKTGRGFYDYSKPIPEPATIAPGEMPKRFEVVGRCSPPEARLLERLRPGTPLRNPNDDDDRRYHAFELDGFELSVTASYSEGNEVSIDLLPDYASCSRVAVWADSQVTDEDLGPLAALFGSAGIGVSRVRNMEGSLVGRTLAMLVGEAARCLASGVASAQEIDAAIVKGLRFPVAPLAWADECGGWTVREWLSTLRWEFGDAYVPSTLPIPGDKFYA